MFCVDAVRKNALTARATVAEIDNKIKTWLRGAADRHGGRAKRNLKARAKLHHQQRRLLRHRRRSVSVSSFVIWSSSLSSSSQVTLNVTHSFGFDDCDMTEYIVRLLTELTPSVVIIQLFLS